MKTAHDRKSRLFLFTITLLCLVFLGELAQADLIRGLVRRRVEGGDLYLVQADSNELLRVISTDPKLNADLARLSDGDLITGSGTISVQGYYKKVVRLTALNTVGLLELLGVWKTPEWEVFEFKDFSRLFLYVAAGNPNNPISLAKTRELHYMLAPGGGNSYSIFMSDNSSIHVGSLEFSKNSSNVNLTVFDSTTGGVSQNLSLTPLQDVP